VRLTRELQKGIIVAPYRGVIAERNAEVGDFVPAGRPYFRILDDAQPIVELNVPAKIAKQLEVGQGVWVRRNESVLPAKVATIAPTLNQSSRTQLLTLNTISAAETADWAFGEVVEVHFWLPTENTGFWLPYSALQREVSGLWSTYVLAAADDAQIADNPINARIVERRIVEILQLEDTHALVRGAIDEGDLVIVDGLNRIVPGQKVKPNVLTREYQQSVPQGAGA
jgi:multidrug efflux pump subunit AcrA (membrane-fusion protein)